MKVPATTIAIVLLVVAVAAEPILHAVKAPTIDLDYAVYQGSYDANNSINVFKGIRYAAPPLGKLRFAVPQAPTKNRTNALPATSDPPICPQTGASILTPAEYGFLSGPGDEDCLFLNVYAPVNAENLPVWFWIHGGGYGLFSATGLDPTEFMVANNNSFVSVIIQYRLGAFGFLSSGDVKKNGALNAGLLDMNFALKWVQTNIGKFGGDAKRVTIAGESAGAGAVLYQGLAYGGKQKEKLFQNIIAASPYLTEQYDYNATKPMKAYNDFATAAGCAGSREKLACLRSANTTVLQNASQKVSEAGPFGTFAFLPVTDGTFVQQRATQGLLSKSLNGKRILSTNLANEGIPLSPPYTQTLADFRSYVNTTFPAFNSTDLAALEEQYSYDGDTLPKNPSASIFSTTGTTFPTAVNQSVFGTGQQQRVFNVFAESTLDCPSYWAASAYPQAWHYQFSASPAYHGYDLQALWSGTPTPGASFKHAFRKIWGNFITTNTPVISVDDAKGGVANSTTPAATHGGNVHWPQWDSRKPVLLNLNATGGVPTFLNVTQYLQYNIYSDPGMSNSISTADATAWEGGRGKRCDFWAGVAAKVPY